MILLYLVTPLLGSFRNYIKYKQLKLLMFLRTPLTYFLINLIFQQGNIYQTLIYERWFFFVYKTFLSIYHNDYIKKKEKYKIKYGLQYKD